MNKFYITNAIPYVNGKLHVGHTLEFIQSDTIARYHRALNEDVLYLCGADENALKNVQSALEQGENVQQFVDKNAASFLKLSQKLACSFDVFQKTSAKEHHLASQKLWELCAKNGDIYKKSYQGLYCVGCEEFKTPEELNDEGKCPEHPLKNLETVEEENYFFRLSKYQNELLQIIESNQYQIIPEFRKNEIVAFIKSGLKDFSISRSNQRAKNWGIPVPSDPTQRIYVWFDALNVYQSGIGFGADERSDGARLRDEVKDKRGSSGITGETFTEKDYQYWWPADLHVIGKGIIRFHAVYWPAMLLSAGLKLPKKLFVHEYFTVNGQKIGKSSGNAIDPLFIVDQYGTDALRYYCLAKFSPFTDGDFSEETLKEVYNADLANGLGNLVARIAKLCALNKTDLSQKEKLEFFPQVKEALDQYLFNEALQFIWSQIRLLDQKINQEEPWKIKEQAKLASFLQETVFEIRKIAFNLTPFLPQTAEEILTRFKGPEVLIKSSLFARLSPSPRRIGFGGISLPVKHKDKELRSSNR